MTNSPDEHAHEHKIALVAYPGVQMSAVLGLEDLFSIANNYGQQSQGQRLAITQITSETIDQSMSSSFEAIILPPNMTASHGEDELNMHKWLRFHHARGSILCSVCGGVFWLGYSGLLKGRPVTTHWLLADEVGATFPEVQVQADHLLIDDHDIVTAGGLMAWLDLGLFLVNRMLGQRAMLETARHLLIDPAGREQRNYRSFRPALAHGDEPIKKLQHWLEANTGGEVTVKSLAERAGLSERTFLRRFKAATKHTPNAYVQNLRIEKARGLLERTGKPVSEIGWLVGYHDSSAFSRVFKTTTGLSAGAYRKRFGGHIYNTPSSPEVQSLK